MPRNGSGRSSRASGSSGHPSRIFRERSRRRWRIEGTTGKVVPSPATMGAAGAPAMQSTVPDVLGASDVRGRDFELARSARRGLVARVESEHVAVASTTEPTVTTIRRSARTRSAMKCAGKTTGQPDAARPCPAP